jgi:general transcription factor 3C protein 4
MLNRALDRSKLAMATSDGLVTLLDVLRTPVLGHSGDVSWSLEAHKATIAGQSDRRNITSLYWHDSGVSGPSAQCDTRGIEAESMLKGLLVWTKSGSVSLCRDQAISSNWIGIRELRLRKVGNWAGANSINNCVGESWSVHKATQTY